MVSIQWDSDGNLTRKSYADGTHVDYTYDTRGNLTSATDSTGTTTFTYYANDYLTRIDYPGGQWLAFTYDAGGRCSSSTDQLGHELHYQYDSAGRLSTITDESGSQVMHYDYDAAGRLSRKTLGNGVYTTYEYDAASQLLHLVNYAPDGSVVSRFDYTYDSRGRRTSMATSYGTWTYEYDDMGQLTHAVLASTDPSVPSQDLQYVYDAVGNRVYTIENVVRTDYTTNNLNQYTKVGDTTYIFDADGNLISETSPTGSTTYSYDDENRLIAVHNGPDSWTYTYDAFDQRIQTDHNGHITNYIIDPIGLGNVVGEYDSLGNLIASYDYGFGLISRTSAAGSTGWYTYDALGTTSELTGTAGVVANSYVYAPFGALLGQTGTVANPFQFMAEWGVINQDVRLDFMRERAYFPWIGRFAAPDPIGLQARDFNLYRYVSNNPTNLIDPSGLQEESSLGGMREALERRNKYLDDLFHNRNVDDALDKATEAQNDFAKHAQDASGELITEGAGTVGLGFAGMLGGTAHAITGGIEGLLGLGTLTGLLQGQSHSVTSGDPNQKSGPAGFGTAEFISDSTTIGYRIDFENEAIATAPAQRVVITDQLDSDLDWSRFELTEIGFGDQLISVPDNLQHYETTVPMSYNGVDFEVQIEAGINFTMGVVTAVFQSLDPNTGLPPDVLTGFLPPEDGTGRGMGHLSYTIQPKAGLPNGTEIRNIALISFDGQPEIATNQLDPHDPSKGIDPDLEARNTIFNGPISVWQLHPTSTGFVAELTAGPDEDILNLFSTETGGQGPADVTLMGAMTGVITGSLVMDNVSGTLTFVKTGGVLAPDTYTVTLGSRSDGLRDTKGVLLDGNADGLPGGDYVNTFTIAPSAARVLSVPDFARGPDRRLTYLLRELASPSV